MAKYERKAAFRKGYMMLENLQKDRDDKPPLQHSGSFDEVAARTTTLQRDDFCIHWRSTLRRWSGARRCGS